MLISKMLKKLRAWILLLLLFLSLLANTHRKIRLIESNAECRYLKKLTRKGTLRQVSETPSPPMTPFSTPYTMYTCIFAVNKSFSALKSEYPSQMCISVITYIV
jgi:hypothetical protein